MGINDITGALVNAAYATGIVDIDKLEALSSLDDVFQYLAFAIGSFKDDPNVIGNLTTTFYKEIRILQQNAKEVVKDVVKVTPKDTDILVVGYHKAVQGLRVIPGTDYSLLFSIVDDGLTTFNMFLATTTMKYENVYYVSAPDASVVYPEGTSLVDIIKTDFSFFRKGVHPDAKGHKYIAKRVLDKLVEINSGTSKGRNGERVMKATQWSFRRVEKKYLLNMEQYERLRVALRDYIEPDDYPKSTICNVYYDTPDYLLISRSLEKPVYKEKFRLRSYGVPKETGKVFLEIKKKYDGVVYKRRVRAPEAEAVDYLSGGPAPDVKNKQIMSEIDWFVHSYKGLGPGMFLAYDRLAFRGKEDPNLRITFDWNIRYRTDHMDLIYGDYGRLLYDEDYTIMEIKIPGAAPLWLTDILSQQHIYSTPFSKYGRCYEQMMREKENHPQEAATYAG